jgi:hypothetical protein
MLRSLNQFFNQAFRKTRTVNNEPMNRVSLIVILLVDLFIVGNVFAGLDAIGNWHLSPDEVTPCRVEWLVYRDSKAADRDYPAVLSAAAKDNILSGPEIGSGKPSTVDRYQQSQVDRLGKVSPVCFELATLQDGLYTPEMKKLRGQIGGQEAKIDKLKAENQQIRSQYDSTLLERIAGQDPANSINNVKAEQAKAKLTANEKQIAELNGKLKASRLELVGRPESQTYLKKLQSEEAFNQVDQVYQKAGFWFPTIRLGLQALFLLPLMAIALGIHNFALRRGHGLVALMTWHLLCIFFIPLVFKVFEFLQFGVIARTVFDFVIQIVGNLVFLLNYISILSVPLFGFVLIKLVQKVILNPQAQAMRRVQKNQCLRCAKTLQPGDTHCPHCGYHQLVECPSCHGMTYKHLPHCRHCGSGRG